MENLIHIVTNEVVLYRRSRSARWQARLKLADSTWRRVSTKEHDNVKAGKVALKLYYESEFKREHKLPQDTRRFGSVSDALVKSLKAELDDGKGKVVYHTYISAIEQYLKPFFAKHNIDSITPKLLAKFDEWRLKKFGRSLAASTITNHNSSLNRVFKYAHMHGWITRDAISPLPNKGKKGQARPAFTLEEYTSLIRKMPTWCKKGHTAKTRDMRELLRDYVLIMANTGIRHGTEAQSLKWRNIDWITKDGQRYLRFTVDGKTGKHTLIPRVNVDEFLRRIQSRFKDLAELTFDELIKAKKDVAVFRLRDGSITKNLNQSFRQLMRDTKLEYGATSDLARTLYSLRHTYATFALKNGIGIHELARQMGTSVKMIEAHYSKITPELLADKFAGRRYEKKAIKNN